MIAYIMTVGRSDVELLKGLLPRQLLAGIGFLAAESLSSVDSIAVSLLVDERKPLAIVVNAETVDEERIEERRLSLEESVTSFAAGVPVEIVVAVPSLEVVFFQEPRLLEEIVGRQLTPEQTAFARALPKMVLGMVLEGCAVKSPVEILTAATPQQLEVFRSSPPIEQLSSFLATVQEREKAGAGVGSR
ncbi:MAG TPA: hypothetical protein VNH11_28055 [Pirellulales bacterium]|nr:hypothetical protein [Pirellulales bacterium]